METLRRRAAIRAAIHQGTIARALMGHALDDLAASLGSVDAAERLALCHAPRPDHIQGDLDALASFAGVDVDTLTHALAGVVSADRHEGE
jgi:hypothetical protein